MSRSPNEISRRHFLQDCGIGLGKIAAAGLLTDSLTRSAPAALPRPHFPGRAKAVIHLFMAGAPSQLDLFDPKPTLQRLEGKPLPKSIIGDQRYAFIQPDAAVLGPQFEFRQHGQSGAVLARRSKHLGKVADEICFIKSVHTDQFNHAPAQIFFNTGFSQPGRPSLGLVGGLRSRLRDARPPRLRRDEHRRRAQWWVGALVERLPPNDLHRRAIPQRARPDPQCLDPSRLQPTSCRRTATS